MDFLDYPDNQLGLPYYDELPDHFATIVYDSDYSYNSITSDVDYSSLKETVENDADNNF